MDFSSKFHKEIAKEKKIIDIDKIFYLKKEQEIILPLGSCFLDEFSYYLHDDEFRVCSDIRYNPIIKLDRDSSEKAFQFYFGNFYNPLNLLNNLERIILKSWKFNKTDFIFDKKFNHYINLFLKARSPKKKLSEIKLHLNKIDKYLYNEIKKSTLILLCFDSTEVWIDKKNRKAWHTFYGNYFNQESHENKAYLKTLDSRQLTLVMKKIINIIHNIGKNKKIILINSPHSLIATYSNKDNQIADWYAKSTFLSVFTELQSKNVAYFPLFEILNNIPENKKFEKNYLYINSNTKKNIILPMFKKLFF
jgi:hypothetical protein